MCSCSKSLSVGHVWILCGGGPRWEGTIDFGVKPSFFIDKQILGCFWRDGRMTVDG